MKVKYMSQEERKKHDLLEQQKAIYQEELRKQKEQTKKLKEQAENDRKEKKQEVTKASKGT